LQVGATIVHGDCRPAHKNDTVMAMQSHKVAPEWLDPTRKHALKYLTRFVHNPGIECIVREFNPKYTDIKRLDSRLACLNDIADKEWDFRKGRERFEVVANEPMDQPGSELGKIILEGAEHAEMASSSWATLKHYDVVAILGGANMSPYYRLRFALEQPITYSMLTFLGCERPLNPAEHLRVTSYAKNAKNEFDLGIDAVGVLIDAQLTDSVREVLAANGHFTVFQKKDGIPVVVLSAPPLGNHIRANTSDTYQFLRSIEQSSFAPGKNILFVTGSMYRYAQYFDAVREIALVTGANIETIGYEPAYGKVELKPSKVLQELKSAIDAAIRLYEAVQKAV
jgi:hypothetical protein